MVWPFRGRNGQSRVRTSRQRMLRETRLQGEPLEQRNLLTVSVGSFSPATVSSGYATNWTVAFQNATSSVAVQFTAYESADAAGSQLGNQLTSYSYTPTSASGSVDIPAVLRQADLQYSYYLVLLRLSRVSR